MPSDSRRNHAVTAAQPGGCFSTRMSLTDFRVVSLSPSCPYAGYFGIKWQYSYPSHLLKEV